MSVKNFDTAKLLQDESHTWVIKNIAGPKNSVPPHSHRHSSFSIELIVSGEVSHYINGEFYESQKGSVFLFSPFDEHRYEYINDDEVHIECLYFGEDILSPEILSALDVDKTPFAARLSGSDFDEICNDFTLLHKEYQEDNSFRTTILRNITEKIIISTLRAAKIKKREIKNNVQGAVSYIRRHFRENLSLQEVSAAFFVTPNHFCKYFKKYTGTTFKNYLNSLRCDFALSLIQSTKKSMTEICFESGFSSPSYFSKIFAKKFGKPPREFR